PLFISSHSSLSLHDALPIFLFIYQFLISFIVNQTDFMPQPGKPKICIILSENKPVLSSGSHHSIRLMAFLCNKIINKNPYISLRSEEHTSELQSRFDLVCPL